MEAGMVWCYRLCDGSRHEGCNNTTAKQDVLRSHASTKKNHRAIRKKVTAET
jgi:hypothetical protein